MKSFGFPKREESQKTSRTGESFVASFVTKELGWIYRPVHREDDFGIDAYIDLVESGNVTGRTLAVQVKCGESYFRQQTDAGFKYNGSKQHLNLYLNLDLPVILILVREQGQEAYWVEFDIELTFQAGTGWWIEIPKTNLLSMETEAQWNNIAGPTMDYSEEIQNFWALSEAIQNTAFLAVAIPKEEVEALSMHTLTMIIAKLSKSNRLLLSKRNSLEVFFPDYDHDERELYEIPEFRQWMMESIHAGIPWFYFLNTREQSPSLGLVYTCGCEVSIIKRTAEGHYLETKPGDRKKWLEANFANLNQFTEKHHIDEEINKEISEKVMKRYFSVWEKTEKELS